MSELIAGVEEMVERVRANGGEPNFLLMHPLDFDRFGKPEQIAGLPVITDEEAERGHVLACDAKFKKVET